MNIVKTIILILAIAVFGGVAYFALERFDRYMDIVAINSCAETYSQTFAKGEGMTYTRPLEQAVKECVWQKGVRENWTGVWVDLP